MKWPGRGLNRKTVPFRCPKCGDQVAAFLIYEYIFADPGAACLECSACGAHWRLSFFEEEKK